MPGTQANAIPIIPFKLINAVEKAVAPIMRISEKSSNTQLIGTPCFVDTTGFALERTAIDDGTKVIAGFTVEAAHNLTTSGTKKDLTYGSVQNQSSAVNIPIGAPISDGTLGFYVASQMVLFKAKTDDAHTLAQADIGGVPSTSTFGLTKDGTSNYWFVDTTITAVASGACVEIVELIDPIGTVGGLVAFRVLSIRQQFAGS